MISENASGRLNEVDRPIISKIIHLNTKFRDNYYNTSSSDYFYKFPVEIKKAIINISKGLIFIILFY